MTDFLLRYYYFLKDEQAQTESLIHVLRQNSLRVIDSSSWQDFSESECSFFTLHDASGRMNILGIKNPVDAGSWVDAWKLLQDWEEKADLDSSDLMGKLTVFVTSTGKLPDLLKTAASLLPNCKDLGESGGDSRIFRLAVGQNDTEAIYVYTEADAAKLSASLLMRKLPVLHGRIIFLYDLDKILLDRTTAIRREKDELGKELIRILHTKLVMSQPSFAINEELEQDIEGLATAFAKLAEDKKVISDGRKRLEPMLEGVERQFQNEPDFRMDPETVSNMMAVYHKRAEDLRLTYEELSIAEDNHRAAIEVVQSKIQVMNSRTNLATQEQIRELLKVNTAMQKKSLVFQYAAGLIEFIVLAYYSLSIWSHLAHTAAETIPGWIQFIFVFLFSGNTVLLTHYLAEYVQGDTHVRKKIMIASITLAIILGIIFIRSAIWPSTFL